MSSPEELLRGLFGRAPLGEFIRASWGREHVHAPGEAGRFAHLLPWESLNTVLREHRLPPPRLRLVLDGAPVPESTYLQPSHRGRSAGNCRIDHGLLQGQLRRGATLVLDAVDELVGPVGELAEALERTFRERFQVNAYAGFGTSRGFGVHWDDHDVFVLQVAGRKRWRVYGHTRAFPLSRDAEADADPPSGPVWEGVLRAGDVLYLPRGCWHGAVAMGEATLHLTCGATARTGIDLLGWCVDELRARPAFRRDLPRFARPEERAAHVSELRGALVDLLADGVLDRYFAHLDAVAEVRTRMSLPLAVSRAPLSADALLRWLPVRVDRVDPAPDGTARIAAGGRRWTFAAAAIPALRALAGARRISLGALAEVSSLPPETLRVFVRELLEAGLVAVEDAP